MSSGFEKILKYFLSGDKGGKYQYYDQKEYNGEGKSPKWERFGSVIFFNPRGLFFAFFGRF
jgi:hypothetical protein